MQRLLKHAHTSWNTAVVVAHWQMYIEILLRYCLHALVYMTCLSFRVRWHGICICLFFLLHLHGICIISSLMYISPQSLHIFRMKNRHRRWVSRGCHRAGLTVQLRNTRTHPYTLAFVRAVLFFASTDRDKKRCTPWWKTWWSPSPPSSTRPNSCIEMCPRSSSTTSYRYIRMYSRCDFWRRHLSRRKWIKRFVGRCRYFWRCDTA